MEKSKKNSERYAWVVKCGGWHLVKSNPLSVIEESMPPQTKESKHCHFSSQQFFYILNGKAIFEIGDEIIHVENGEEIHIELKIIS